MSPAPARRHQETHRNIFIRIGQFLAQKPCKLYSAPFDVRLTPRKDDKKNKVYTIVQPDICVICDLAKLDDAGCVGAPDLIVEILSPGNSRKEMKEKFEVYEENGVKEYWLIYPYDEYVMVYYLNENGKFIGSKPFVEGELIKSNILSGLEIEVGEIFQY
jgi:Uma2 family endonuclease